MTETLVTDKLSSELDKLWGITDRIESRRNKVLDKLETVIDNMLIDANSDGDKVIMAKMSVINTFTGLLKDTEGTQRENIKVLQKQKENDKPDTDYLLMALMSKIASGEVSGQREKPSLGEMKDYDRIDKELEERGTNENLDEFQEAEVSFESKGVNISDVIGVS